MSTVQKAVSIPSRANILSLYHKMLKETLKFDNYNFREYFLRRTKYEFQKHKSLSDPKQISEAYDNALKQFTILRRQATISEMFRFEKSVMESSEGIHHHSNK